MKTKEIKIQILGKNFNFNIPEKIKTEDFMEIIDFVENKFGQIKSETGDLDSFKLGLLASINITEELFSLMKENERLKAALKKIDNMISPIDINQKNHLSISFSS
jgi:cell division protein ZapA (FtsZ GTPase activity inhibitor)